MRAISMHLILVMIPILNGGSLDLLLHAYKLEV